MIALLAATDLQPSEGFGIANLLIFFGFFLAVLIYTFARRNRKKFEHASHMPLDDSSGREENPRDQ